MITATRLPRGNGIDVTQSIADQTAKQTGYGVSQKPSALAKGLFASSVPHRNDDRHAGGNARFRDSQKEAGCE
jgi:hypothetical protein